MSVYRNCAESGLVPRARVMAIGSLKYKNFTVGVEKKAFLAISDSLST